MSALFRKYEDPDTDRLPEWTDRIPLDLECPDTQPTNPGALEGQRDL